MNRKLLVIVLIPVCAATLLAVAAQGRRLATLRAEQKHLVAELSAAESTAPSAGPDEPAIAHASSATVSPELLRLRSQVTQLTARRNALAGAKVEHERLEAQLAARGTNGSPALAGVAPGYLRKSQARFMGYSTPEDTLQSFLWAIQNRDPTNLVQALTPQVAQRLQGKTEDILRQMQAFVGMGVLGKEQQPDGSMQLKVQVLPDLPPADIRFEQTAGQWKIATPF